MPNSYNTKNNSLLQTPLEAHYHHTDELFKPHITYPPNHDAPTTLPHLQQHRILLNKYPHTSYYLHTPPPWASFHNIAINKCLKNLDPRCLIILMRLEKLPHTCPYQHIEPLNPIRTIQKRQIHIFIYFKILSNLFKSTY